MKAQIISIGDELLIGQTVNTNASMIGEMLTGLQIEVSRVLTIGDDDEMIMSSLESAAKHADLIILTGGLGPTHDDITRSCIVRYFNTELVRNDDVLEDVRERFRVRGRKVTKINEEQALVPKVATAIRNSRGTAPGLWIEKDNIIYVVMPGVPHEMNAMMREGVIPRLKTILGEKKEFVQIKNFLTTGIAESYLYELFGDINEFLHGAKMAFLPNQYGVKMRVTVKGSTEEEAHNKLTELEQKIRATAGRFIYGKDNDTMEEAIGRLLVDRGLTVSVAESCTGGLIAHRLTNISGSSKYIERGVVAYSNAAKVEMLKVDEDLIHKYGAVSLEVARLMAEGVKAVSGTDIGLSVTGIMGPTGATQDKPVGLVYIGVCDDKICTAKEFRFGDDRVMNKERTSQAALDMLRRNLLGIPYDD